MEGREPVKAAAPAADVLPQAVARANRDAPGVEAQPDPANPAAPLIDNAQGDGHGADDEAEGAEGADAHGFPVVLELRNDDVVEVHPGACHHCDFEAEMEMLLKQMEEEGDGGLRVLSGWSDDGWSPDAYSPLDRYPDAADLFDLADQVEEKVSSSTRASRPKKGQGDRASVARADIPKKVPCLVLFAS